MWTGSFSGGNSEAFYEICEEQKLKPFKKFTNYLVLEFISSPSKSKINILMKD